MSFNSDVANFNKYDWMANASATEFEDGSAPMIWSTDLKEVLIDAEGVEVRYSNGITVAVYLYERRNGDSKALLLMIAERAAGVRDGAVLVSEYNFVFLGNYFKEAFVRWCS